MMSVRASGKAAVMYANKAFPVPAYFYFSLSNVNTSVTVHAD